MKRVGIFAATLAATVFLVGCGNNAQTPERDTPDGRFMVGTVKYKGKDVDCIFWKAGAGNAAHGGMSCDFLGGR